MWPTPWPTGHSSSPPFWYEFRCSCLAHLTGAFSQGVCCMCAFRKTLMSCIRSRISLCMGMTDLRATAWIDHLYQDSVVTKKQHSHTLQNLCRRSNNRCKPWGVERHEMIYMKHRCEICVAKGFACENNHKSLVPNISTSWVSFMLSVFTISHYNHGL